MWKLLPVFCSLLAAAPAWQIVALSSRPDKISGGDALLRIDVPNNAPLTGITVKRNGQDVTSSFRADASQHALIGLVRGLRTGQNLIEAFHAAGSTQLNLVNYASTGPGSTTGGGLSAR